MFDLSSEPGSVEESVDYLNELWEEHLHKNEILEQIKAERERQKTLTFGGQPASEFDKKNGQGDWIGYINRYASGAHPKLETKKDPKGFRQAMIQVAALAVAAIENYDAGNCS